jgi:hypothetical protein
MNPGIRELSLFYTQYITHAWKGKGPGGADGADPGTGPTGLIL